MDREKTRKELEEIIVSKDEALEFAESIVNTVREPLIVLDQDLRVVSASRSFYEFFKVSPEETVGQLIYDLGNKQWDIPGLRELLETILPQKITFDSYEVEHDFTTIGRRTMLLNARQIQRVPGKKRIILLAIEDITERKRLENLLIKSEDIYRGIFRTASDGILLLEKREGRITHINPAAVKMLGYSAKECIGNKLYDTGFMPDMDDFQTIMQNLSKYGIVNYTDVPVTNKSGQHVDTDIYLVDKTEVVQCNIRDITDRKLVEEKLLETSNYLQNLITHANSPIIIWDLQFRITRFNRAFESLTGRNVNDVIGKSIKLLFPMAEAENTMKLIRETLTGKRWKTVEINIQHIGGHIRTVLWNSATIFSQDSKTVVAIIAQGQDITEQKRAEEDLKLSEEKYRSIFENAVEGIFQTTPEGQLISVNPALASMIGYDSPEAMIKGVTDVGKQLYVNPEERVRYKKTLEEQGIIKGFEIQHYKKDKSKIWVSINARAVKDEAGKVSLYEGTIGDITSRKLSEEKLRKSLAGTIQALSSTVETRDPYTAGHQRRVSNLARAIAKEMGLTTDMIDTIRLAGIIHDIGKISVPAEILSKPGKLLDMEMNLIEAHSQTGYDILKDVELPYPIAEIVLQHHERLDGSGYPKGLEGDQIILEARIIAVADVVEAIASYRPYRPALGIDVALAEIEKNKGILYDEKAVEVCVRLFREKGFTFESTEL